MPNSGSSPLSIFLLSRALELGGTERQLIALATGLRDRGHSVTVGLFYRSGELVEDLERSGVPMVDLRKSGRWDLFGFSRRAVAALRRANPDVIYSFLVGPNLISAATRPFVRNSHRVWGFRASDMQLREYGWIRWIGFRMERIVSAIPDLIISNSSAGAAHAVAYGFPRDKFVVVPNGIDTSRFRPDPELRKLQRRKFGLSDDETAIGVMARLDPMKGHPVFLRAAAIARARAPNLRFLCIGNGSEFERLKVLGSKLGLGDRVMFTGAQEPVAALNALDIACSCSVWGEGFSNSIAEAMACGLPCIVTDVGDSAAIVGSAGIVVPASSPEALAQAMLTQSASLDRHEPEKVRARIVENFSVDAMVEGTLKAFRQRLAI